MYGMPDSESERDRENKRNFLFPISFLELAMLLASYVRMSLSLFGCFSCCRIPFVSVSLLIVILVIFVLPPRGGLFPAQCCVFRSIHTKLEINYPSRCKFSDEHDAIIEKRIQSVGLVWLSFRDSTVQWLVSKRRIKTERMRFELIEDNENRTGRRISGNESRNGTKRKCNYVSSLDAMLI